MRQLPATEWNVLTGGPSSGKTTVLRELENRGYLTLPEPAQICIEMRKALGELLDDICGPQFQQRLQREILAKALEQQSAISPSHPYFLDRSNIDCIAYCWHYGLDPQEFIQASGGRRYSKVFMLERLPFEPNGVRIETDETAARLALHTQAAYESLGYEVIDIPVMDIKDRVDMILDLAGLKARDAA